MLQDMLRDTWVYQEIGQEFLEKGLEEGLEKGLEKGFEKGRQEALQQELRQQREALLDVIRERFPKLVRLAKKQAEAIEDTAILLRLIIKMAKVSTAEEAKQLLLDAAEEET